jgi:hypothetical protein
MLLDTVKPGEAYPAIKQLLLEDGSASTILDGNLRIVEHSRVRHRPLQKLPWPLSKIQPHVLSLLSMKAILSVTHNLTSWQRGF